MEKAMSFSKAKYREVTFKISHNNNKSKFA